MHGMRLRGLGLVTALLVATPLVAGGAKPVAAAPTVSTSLTVSTATLNSSGGPLGLTSSVPPIATCTIVSSDPAVAAAPACDDAPGEHHTYDVVLQPNEATKTRSITFTLTVHDLLGTTTRHATVAEAGVPAGGYVALGDSFASGEGAGGHDWVGFDGMTGVSMIVQDRCDRSRSGYPVLLDRWLTTSGFGPQPLDFLACGGATSSDVDPASPARALGLRGATLDSGELPQLTSAAQLANARIVTLTAGGNDLGFAAVMSGCFLEHALDVLPSVARIPFASLYLRVDQASLDLPATLDEARAVVAARDSLCSSDSLVPWTRDLTKDIGASDGTSPLARTMVAVWRDVLAAAPRAEVYATGYPELVPLPGALTVADSRAGCGSLPGSGLTFLGTEESRLFAAMAAAAASVSDPRFHYVPLDRAYAAHTLCSPHPWLNGLRLASTGHLPDAVSLGGSYHPNTDGQAATATAVEAALTALLRRR